MAESQDPNLAAADARRRPAVPGEGAARHSGITMPE